MQIQTQLIKYSAALLTIFAVSCAEKSHSTEKSHMKTKLQPVEMNLNASKQTDQLQDTIIRIEHLPDTIVKGKFDPEMRKNKALAYLRVLREIEESIDLAFNTDEMPSINIAPPLETGLPAGIDPKAIEDGKLRKEYEIALAANARKMEFHHEQTILRRLKSDLRQEILTYVGSAYLGVPKAKEELAQLSKEASIDKEFSAALQSKVNP